MSTSQAPPVAAKAMIAFVLPVATFVISLAVLDRLLQSTDLAEGLRALVVFCLGLAATLLLMAAVRLIVRSSGSH